MTFAGRASEITHRPNRRLPLPPPNPVKSHDNPSIADGTTPSTRNALALLPRASGGWIGICAVGHRRGTPHDRLSDIGAVQHGTWPISRTLVIAGDASGNVACRGSSRYPSRSAGKGVAEFPVPKSELFRFRRLFDWMMELPLKFR
jgi:hypothetical protein